MSERILKVHYIGAVSLMARLSQKWVDAEDEDMDLIECAIDDCVKLCPGLRKVELTHGFDIEVVEEEDDNDN